MKTIRNCNIFAVGLPSLLFLLSIIDKDFLFYGAISTIVTGIIQVILGFALFFRFPRNRYVHIYLISVAAFFLFWIISGTIFDYAGISRYILLSTPPALAVYLTIIIFINLEK